MPLPSLLLSPLFRKKAPDFSEIANAFSDDDANAAKIFRENASGIPGIRLLSTRPEPTLSPENAARIATAYPG